MANRPSPRARSAELSTTEPRGPGGAVLELAASSERFARGMPAEPFATAGGASTGTGSLEATIRAVSGALGEERSGRVSCGDVRAAGAAFAAAESGALWDGMTV